jgi:hypothetical protein
MTSRPGLTGSLTRPMFARNYLLWVAAAGIGVLIKIGKALDACGKAFM